MQLNESPTTGDIGMERLDPVMVQLNGINGHNGLNGRLPNGQDHQLHRTLPHSMNYNTQRYFF